MRKIIFATNNKHKLDEIRSILGPSFEIVSLSDIGCTADIPETGQTLEENASQKAWWVYNHYHQSCFADDTGLEVTALGGAPGVHSARYAEGSAHDSAANMARLLRELGGEENRSAQFRTVIALIDADAENHADNVGEFFFEGIVKGRIDTEKHGTEGFGYDPLFVPDGYNQSFAELGLDVKNAISHRARAVAKLAEWLQK